MEQIEIKNVYFSFTHAEKSYIVFDLMGSEYIYLYFFNPKNQNHSLFYGENLHHLIKKYLKNPKIECIECQIGTKIIGAISFDDGELIESNLTKIEANRILNTLKGKLKEKKAEIILFL